jgi:hypothetical protein
MLDKSSIFWVNSNPSQTLLSSFERASLAFISRGSCQKSLQKKRPSTDGDPLQKETSMASDNKHKAEHDAYIKLGWLPIVLLIVAVIAVAGYVAFGP